MRPVDLRALLTVLCACTWLLLAPLPPGALAQEAAPVTGNATHFDGLGSPYGGCGLPQSALETQDFVALNVYDTPGDYSFYPRPLPPELADKVGLWDNGRNCGRWVRVTIGDYCTGINDGAPGQPFCRNGTWVSDAYNGATLTMLVADSCGDANAWCRDDPYHLDLATASLNRFVKDGVPVGDLHPGHWNNRRVTWSFVPAPNYTGDIQIGFLQNAQRWWPAIAVSRLPNGIHGVEYLAGGTWQQAQMNGDMGQSYVIGPTEPGGTQYRIRVRDASDQLLAGGRVYSFSLPAACSPQCSAVYTPVSYTTDSGGSTTTSTTTTQPTTTTTQPTTTTTPAPASCTATPRVASQWPGGFQAEVTVRNTGTAAIAGWRVTWTFPGEQRVVQLWNGSVTVNGSSVTVTSASWNGSLAAGATTSFGFIASGSASALPGLACTPA